MNPSPTPADEALALRLSGLYGCATVDQIDEAAQLIAAHVAAQAETYGITLDKNGKLLTRDIVHTMNRGLERRIKQLEAVAAQAPSGLVEGLDEAVKGANAILAAGIEKHTNLWKWVYAHFPKAEF